MLLRPKLPDYDVAAWQAAPFADRVRWICVAWAKDGYGTPLAVHGAYALKILAYIAVWFAFCLTSTGHEAASFGTWWASDEAFTKAILWTMLFEGLGFGCGSGPLSGRYVPPLGGLLYFLRPGTTKLPFLAGMPLTGGHRRTVLDVALYATTLGVLVWGLTAPNVSAMHLWPLLVLLPAMAIGDKTLFLVFRSEHYLSIAICLLFADAIAGSKLVWMAIWWWAATSKLNHHFPAVMGVMTSNAPFTAGTPLRRWVYRSYPDDLRPSRLAAWMAHFGTLTEYAVPLVLLMSGGGTVTWVALFVMVGFHLFILFNVPMGVPLEWNVVMIYGALVLFGVHADVSVFSISSTWLWAWLVGFHVVVPLVGSQFPHRVSFLLAMRYYAGNWAYSVWLFEGASRDKLDQLTTSAPDVRAQLRWLYDDDTLTAMLSKVMAFRAMHILGRAAVRLAPRAVPDIDARDWVDGELIAGRVLGWNFGDGHLHQQQLLDAVQAQCGFAPGELRCLFVESQPFFGRHFAWRIVDAATGEIERGRYDVHDLKDAHPWPDGALPPPVHA